ncbi:hypothetical protein M514_02378 [Trichuris suis]|uniref:MI domain-containing protein n=1 Tax=Trichuris suis TaxID=68888 RepID=A0A085NBQ5_9BILA|nr:hypothetical protein M514_02378 [Trichuris suis]
MIKGAPEAKGRCCTAGAPRRLRVAPDNRRLAVVGSASVSGKRPMDSEIKSTHGRISVYALQPTLGGAAAKKVEKSWSSISDHPRTISSIISSIVPDGASFKYNSESEGLSPPSSLPREHWRKSGKSEQLFGSSISTDKRHRIGKSEKKNDVPKSSAERLARHKSPEVRSEKRKQQGTQPSSVKRSEDGRESIKSPVQPYGRHRQNKVGSRSRDSSAEISISRTNNEDKRELFRKSGISKSKGRSRSPNLKRRRSDSNHSRDGLRGDYRRRSRRKLRNSPSGSMEELPKLSESRTFQKRQDSLKQVALEQSLNQSYSKAEEFSREGHSANDEKKGNSQLNVSPKTKFRESGRVNNNQEFLRQESPKRRSDEGLSDTSSHKKLPVESPSRLADKVVDVNSEADSDLKEWIEKKHSKSKEQERLGGAYIPPMKLRAMQASITDKNSQEYQRIAWDQLKKHIHGLVNRVNASNIIQVIEDLFKVNLIRGRGIFVRAIMQAQSFAQPYSFIMAALAAVVNSKFPAIGELLLHRLLSQFKRAFRRNDRDVAVPAVKFIAHLINQQVAHEVLALELLTLLLENPTDDSVELSVAFLKECGAKMSDLSPVGMNGIAEKNFCFPDGFLFFKSPAIFDRLRSILHEAEVDPRVQFMIEVLFQIRKDKFVNNPPIAEGLDLVEEEDQITHAVSLDSELNLQEELNLFRYDAEFEKNEQAYEDIRNEIFESESETEEVEEKSDEETDKQNEQVTAGQNAITDLTETNLITFRRTVYLTIQSSLDFQEAIHKLLKMDIRPGYEAELCNMILDCCAQQRTYEKFFGLMAERFCRLKQEYQHHFESLFKDVYLAVHRFEITKLRNSARLFAHLLFTDSISWMPLHCIRLTEADTTSPGRIFIKILFHELVEFMGLQNLFDRIEDATMQAAFDGLFPRDHPHNTRFAINFYTSIGLGALTIGMREHLKNVPKEKVVKLPPASEQVEAEHD